MTRSNGVNLYSDNVAPAAPEIMAAILRTDLPPDLLADLRDLLRHDSWRELRLLARSLAPMLWAFALGSLLGAIALALVAYRAALTMIVRHRRRAASARTPEHTDL